MVLKVGQALDKRSKLKLPLAGEAANFFEDAAPAVMKAQLDHANASINASLDVAKSIRENMAARASGENDEEYA